MKKKSKAAAEPTLVFYKKVEWEQMAFRRRREEIMVAVSVLLSELEIVVVSVVSETVSLVSVSVMDVLSAVVISVSEDAVTEVVVSVVVVVTVAVVEPGVGSIGVWFR